MGSKEAFSRVTAERLSSQSLVTRAARAGSKKPPCPHAPTHCSRLPTRSTPSRPVPLQNPELQPHSQRERDSPGSPACAPSPPGSSASRPPRTYHGCTADGVPRGAAHERGLPRQLRDAAPRALRLAPDPAPRGVGRRHRHHHHLRIRRRPPGDQGQSRSRIAVRSACIRLPTIGHASRLLEATLVSSVV